MKPFFLLAGVVAVVIAGCDQQKTAVEDLKRKNAELQSRIEQQERMAKVRAAEETAAKQAAANEETARRLADDRAALEVEKAKLTETQRSATEEDFRRREEAINAEERRLADARETAATQAATASERERDLLATQPAADTQTPDLFYDSLDPYGNWADVEGYGYVFQPNIVVTAGWRPYQDGCWIHTDHGWAWRSNEPFGWATYHYGRWIRLNRRGWVWVPGSEWAPAWVSWRRNDEYIGWAPLPPEAHCASGFNSAVDHYYDIGASSYVFVPHRHFCGWTTYVGHVIEPARNVQIIQQTVNITNITYQKVNQQTVLVNAGPDFAMVRAASAVPVPTLRLQRLNARGSHESVGAGVFSMFAPALAHVSPQSKPKNVKFSEAHDVDHGWAGVTAAEQAAIRDRHAAEARQIEAWQRAGVTAAPPVGTRAPVAPAAIPGNVPVPHPIGTNLPAVVANPPVASHVSTLVPPAASTSPAPTAPAPVPPPAPRPIATPFPVAVAPPARVAQPQPIQRPPTPPRSETPPQRVISRKPVPAATPPLTEPEIAPQPRQMRPSGNAARPSKPTPTPKGSPNGRGGLKQPDVQ